MHKDIELLIEKALNDEITSKELEKLQEHIEKCEECREKYEAGIKLKNGIQKSSVQEYNSLPDTFERQSEDIVTGVSNKKMRKNTIAVIAVSGIVILGIAAFSLIKDNFAGSSGNDENKTASTVQSDEISEETTDIIENYNGNKGWTYNTQTGIISRAPQNDQNKNTGGEIANLDKIKNKEYAFDTSWFRTPNPGLNHYFYFEFKSEEDLAKFFPNYKKQPEVRNGYLITITKSELEKAIDKYSDLDFKYSKILNIKTENKTDAGQVFATTISDKKSLK